MIVLERIGRILGAIVIFWYGYLGFKRLWNAFGWIYLPIVKFVWKIILAPVKFVWEIIKAVHDKEESDREWIRKNVVEKDEYVDLVDVVEKHNKKHLKHKK